MNKFKLKGHYSVVCHDKNGKLKWEEGFDNLIVNTGLDYALEAALGAGTQITSWFVGLTDGTPTVAATDTPASHAGWVDVTDFNEAARPALVLGATAAQSIDNSASPAVFTINATATVGGCFIIDSATKGGTSGTLFSAGAFTGGDRAVVDTDVLSVTYTVDASDA